MPSHYSIGAFVKQHVKQALPITRLTVLIATALALTTCTNPMLATLQSIVTEYQKPTASLDFASGSSLAETTPIVVSFSDSMDPSSLSLDGTLAQYSDDGSWSATAVDNDTLTITPLPAWPVGNDRSLTISCSDTDTYEMEAISATYGVLEGVIYVHAAAGSDANPGTHDRPKASVQAAVEAVERVYDEAQVKIAGGDYFTGVEVFVQKRLDLIGGYKPDNWSVNDPLLYESVIKVIATSSVSEASTISFFGNSSAGSTATGLTIVLSQPRDGHGISVINSSVTLTNLDISVAANEFASGISIDTSTVVISNCSVSVEGSVIDTIGRGVTALLADVTLTDALVEGGFFFAYIGVVADDSTLTMERCRVNNGLATETNFGVMMTNTLADLRNNIVYAGVVNHELAAGSGAVLIDSSDVTLWNNTLDGGSAANTAGDANTHGIILNGTGDVRIENNIILAVAGDIRLGVKQISSTGTPSQFNNNLLFLAGHAASPPNAAYRYVPTEILVSNNAALIEFFDTHGGSADANLIDVDPKLDVTDYSFTVDSPPEVTTGGRDLTTAWPGEWDGASDILGNNRTGNGTTGWSMGAYEQD